MEKIRIVMGGYLNKDEKLMTRPELNTAITEIQKENEKLKELSEKISNSACDNCTGEYIPCEDCEITKLKFELNQ